MAKKDKKVKDEEPEVEVKSDPTNPPPDKDRPVKP